MSSTKTEQILNLRLLQAEIENLIKDSTDTYETLPDKVEAHNNALAALLAVFESEQIDDEDIRLFLKATQEKIARWTAQAIEERDETRQTLLNLAQGRKARSKY